MVEEIEFEPEDRGLCDRCGRDALLMKTWEGEWICENCFNDREVTGK